MNRLAVGRIIWKEFRQQIVFFALLALIALVVQLLVVQTMTASGGFSADTAHWPFAIVGLFAILYGAACGATLYATEKEERTFQILQTLPLNSRQLLTGKLAVALTLCLAFLLAAILIAILCASMAKVGFVTKNPGQPFSWALQFLGTFGLGVVEFFAWSWLFSLLVKRPLVAAVLGIAAASSVVQLITQAVTPGAFEPFTLAPYAQAAGYRAVALVPVLLLSGWLAGGWLVNRSPTASRLLLRTRDTATANDIASSSSKPGRLRIFGRFLWQAWRTSWPLLLVYTGCMTLLVGLAFVAGRQFVVFALALCFVVAAVAGVFAFASDKVDGGARFLAHHGAGPGTYWLAHVLIWLGWILVINNVIGLAILWFAPIGQALTTQSIWTIQSLPQSAGFWMQTAMIFVSLTFAVYFTVGMALCFAGGQLVSLLIRSRVLAGIAALLVSVPLAIWHLLMMASETPLWWSVVLLLMAFLLAGYLATRNWLSEHRHWSRTIPVLLIPLVTWAGLAAGVIWKRQNEIQVYPQDIANYRTELGEPDTTILEDMRRRFVTAMDGLEWVGDLRVPTNGVQTRVNKLVPSIGSLMQDYLDYQVAYPDLSPDQQGLGYYRPRTGLASQQSPADGQPTFYQFMSFDNQSTWQQFIASLGRGPVGFQQQFELVQQVVEANRSRIEQLREAIQFAADNYEHIQRLEPVYDGKEFAPGQPVPPLPNSIYQSSNLLLIDFYAALMRGDSRAAWKSLRAYEMYRKIHATIYGHQYYYWRFQSFEHYQRWLRLPDLDADTLDEALAFLQSDWTLPLDERRLAEHEYLDMTHQIQSGLWDETGESRNSFDALQRRLLNLFPWERVRSQRLVDLWATWYVEVLRSRKYTEETGEYQSPVDGWAEKTGERYGPYGSVRHGPLFGQWVDNTILPPEGGMFVSLVGQGREGRDMSREYSANRHRTRYFAETRREMLILKMAVMLWQMREGEMPESLVKLVFENEKVRTDFVSLMPLINKLFPYGGGREKYLLLPESGEGDRYIVQVTHNPSDYMRNRERLRNTVPVTDRAMLRVPLLTPIPYADSD